MHLLYNFGMGKVIVDIGTGDGRFVYAGAKTHPENLYIGIDPILKQAEKYKSKANKERLKNLKFIRASVENLPDEVSGVADKVFVNFPWGSLLAGVAKGEKNLAKNISGVLKKGGRLYITFGYSSTSEPGETKRLELSNLSEDELHDEIIPAFKKAKLKLNKVVTLGKSEIFEMESSWAKKLTFGRERKIYRLEFTKL